MELIRAKNIIEERKLECARGVQECEDKLVDECLEVVNDHDKLHKVIKSRLAPDNPYEKPQLKIVLFKACRSGPYFDEIKPENVLGRVRHVILSHISLDGGVLYASRNTNKFCIILDYRSLLWRYIDPDPCDDNENEKIFFFGLLMFILFLLYLLYLLVTH